MNKDKWCRHFNGLFPNGACKAGVQYIEIKSKCSGKLTCLPCIGDTDTPCASYESYTPEELAEQEKRRHSFIEAIAKNISPCCGVPLDMSRVQKNGHGHRYCPKCGKVVFTV